LGLVKKRGKRKINIVQSTMTSELLVWGTPQEREVVQPKWSAGKEEKPQAWFHRTVWLWHIG